MKGISLLFYFSFFIFHFSFSQGGTWTWISGSNVSMATGVYGTQGVPSVNNHPPALYEACEWKDRQGNFWVGGGTINVGNYSDLWKFNPVTLEWTWVKGDQGLNEAPVYGIKGVPDPANSPGQIGFGADSWVDTTGNLWVFAGIYRNDLWQYDIGTNNWTWMSGDTAITAKGHHGTLGVASASNQPGGRTESASAWTDCNNNLWLFGGLGVDDDSAVGMLNDLCKYNIATNQWTWMKGSNLAGDPGNAGIKGVASAANEPGSRYSYPRWKDSDGNLWMMGGTLYHTGATNDMWKYDITANEWTWMSGDMTANDPGSYTHTCVFDSLDAPAARTENRAATTDNCGRFWLFGGSNLNDLWVFDPKQLRWKWLSGTNVASQPGNYGTLGVPSPSNIPPSRWGALSWWGNDNKFYLFGGMQSSFVKVYGDLWVFDPDTNCISFSCNMPTAVAGFEANKTSICANDCINFTNLSTNAVAWQWIFPGGEPPSSTDQNPQQVCYLDSGVYKVTLIAANNANFCLSIPGGSDTLSMNNYITVNAAPPIPNILEHKGIASDTLSFSNNGNYISYQWYKDTALIQNATDTFLIITQSGNYNVAITGINGCKTSVGINVIIGLQNYMSDHVLSLWPNPVTDKFTVYGLQFTVAELDIYNVLGQVCQQSQFLNLKSQIEMNVSSLPAGIYFIQVIGEKGRWEGRFVKE